GKPLHLSCGPRWTPGDTLCRHAAEGRPPWVSSTLKGRNTLSQTVGRLVAARVCGRKGARPA
ncbi:MAG: hypothetical protein VKO21_10990, partial [Candidatus Sericytochromatia bacterium]|nr:hypothetical protein [Candidatus Sericytochromatia bacterium]